MYEFVLDGSQRWDEVHSARIFMNFPLPVNDSQPRKLLIAGADANAQAGNSGATAVTLAARNQDKAMLRSLAKEWLFIS